MRDIIFRGQRVDDEEWVAGYYVNCHNVKSEPHTAGHFIVEYPDKWHEIYTSTIGQYTGLCDCNDTRIFEGDIVESDEKKYVVEWSEHDARFVLSGETVEYDFDNFYGHDLEVIGNVCENKEMVEWQLTRILNRIKIRRG